MHPLVVRVRLPLAIGTPPQQKLKSPVCALTSRTLPTLVSSCKQKLKTLTSKTQLAVLLEVSVAVHVTVVVPTGKGWPVVTKTPFWFLQATVTPGQLSEAVTVKFTGALLAIGHEAAAATLKLDGHVIDGACRSFTVTVNPQPD